MLKIWGRLSSINVQKVVWATRELALPYDRIEAGGEFGVVDTPEFGRMNPNRRVPVIDDNGFLLWESNAIVRYLSSRYGEGSLWPADPCLRADADRWMDWFATMWSPVMTPVFLGLIRTPQDKRDPAVITAAMNDTNARALVLEQTLQDGRQFVTGSQFTIGDIALGCGAHRWLALPAERPEMPAISAWYRRLMTRPAVQGVLTLPLK
jgi:glutathione S-transferase